MEGSIKALCESAGVLMCLARLNSIGDGKMALISLSLQGKLHRRWCPGIDNLIAVMLLKSRGWYCTVRQERKILGCFFNYSINFISTSLPYRLVYSIHHSVLQPTISSCFLHLPSCQVRGSSGTVLSLSCFPHRHRLEVLHCVSNVDPLPAILQHEFPGSHPEYALHRRRSIGTLSVPGTEEMLTVTIQQQATA